MIDEQTDQPTDDIFARAGLTDADFDDDAPAVEGPAEADVAAVAVDTPEGEEAPADGPVRGPDGRFAPKAAAEPAPAADPAPAAVEPPVALNLTPAEKAAWAATPPEARAAVERRVSELQNGIAQYQERFKPVEQYAAMAEASGTTLKAALDSYVGIENELRRDPVAGLEQICSNLGTNLRDIAAKVLGQPAPERDSVIDGLRQELAAVKAQVGTVHQTFQEQRTATATDFVAKFAEQHPRFEELSDEIAKMLKTGYATSLEDAYTKADRFNPAPAPAAAPAAVVTEVPRARTPAANLSVSGTPVGGSNPNPRTPPPDRMSSIDWAFRQVGI